jgi:diguanylate cyclase (GGDEF)-like protein
MKTRTYPDRSRSSMTDPRHQVTARSADESRVTDRSFRSQVVVAAALVVVSVTWLAEGWGSDWATTAVTDLGSLGGALLAGGACLTAARRRDDDRKAWLTLAFACLLWALGEAKWSWDELVVQHEVPFPSIADAAFLAAVPAALVALLRFGRGIGHHRARTLLDGALVAGSLLFVLWAMLLGPIWNDSSQTRLAQTVSLAYPVTDLAMVTVALLTMQWGNVRRRLSLFLLAAGLLLMAGTDLLFTFLTNNGSYSSTDVISVGWIAAYLLIALSARAPIDARSTRSSADDSAEPLASVMLPYVTLALAVVVAVARMIDHSGLDTFLKADVSALVAVLLVRQGVSLRDNRLLVKRLNGALLLLNAREAQLEHLASHDGLTGLANRSRLTAQAEEMGATDATSTALIYIDLDGFKAVNDCFGHATGDLLLIQAAERLRGCIRIDDLVARLGGDEFVVLLRGGLDEATACARRIADAFTPSFEIGGEVANVSASIGIAVAEPGDPTDEAMRRADAAMYAAKRRGKGCAVTYPDMSLVQ